MNRIDRMFEARKAEGACASVFFLTGGFPDYATTKKAVLALAEAGADLIEMGIPFSDPIADGPTIQKASKTALENGATVRGILALIREIRRETDIPLLLFTACNPVFRYGAKAFADDALAAGADGLLIPDLPPEEAGEMIELCRERDLSLVFLVAPTTTPERRRMICSRSSGFVYYISLRGVTGARESLPEDLETNVRALTGDSPLPVVVGFGISRPEHARLVGGLADGVVVGSALIDVIEANAGKPGFEAAVKDFASGLIGAMPRGATA